MRHPLSPSELTRGLTYSCLVVFEGPRVAKCLWKLVTFFGKFGEFFLGRVSVTVGSNFNSFTLNVKMGIRKELVSVDGTVKIKGEYTIIYVHSTNSDTSKTIQFAVIIELLNQCPNIKLTSPRKQKILRKFIFQLYRRIFHLFF